MSPDSYQNATGWNSIASVAGVPGQETSTTPYWPVETCKERQTAHDSIPGIRTEVSNDAMAVHPVVDVDVIFMFVPTAVEDDDTGFEQFTFVWMPLVCTVTVPFRNGFAGN